MELILMRHGHAVSEGVHPERPLSKQGRNQARVMAQKLKNKGLCLERIVHSPKPRAVQTAEIVSQETGYQGDWEMWEGLLPNDPVGPIASKIELLSLEGKVKRLLIAGHLPFLPSLAAELLHHPDVDLRLPEAGILWLKKEKQTWKLKERIILEADSPSSRLQP